MGMGTRKSGQIPMLLAPDQLAAPNPTTPFFDNLNELLARMGFDAYVGKACQPFHADRR